MLRFRRTIAGSGLLVVVLPPLVCPRAYLGFLGLHADRP